MYNRLTKILEYKDNVMVQREAGEYCIFSSFKDENGNFRKSGWFDNNNRSRNHIGVHDGYDKKIINEDAKEENWQIVEIWDNPKRQFVVGDKVKIAENAEEVCKIYEKGRRGFHQDAKKMVGKVYEIEDFNEGDYKIDGYCFPHSALEPVFEEEITVAEAEKIIAEKLGYDVKIK